MKALSLWQPWATLVALKEKQIETRSWATDYRGILAIHATSRSPAIPRELLTYQPFIDAMLSGNYRDEKDLPCGAIVAICWLADCVPITPEFVATLSQDERTFGDYSPSRYAWKLENTRQLAEPILCRGHQRLWNWSERILGPDPGIVDRIKKAIMASQIQRQSKMAAFGDKRSGEDR